MEITVLVTDAKKVVIMNDMSELVISVLTEKGEKMPDIYPLVIVCDRYNGTYSGGKYTAWNHCLDEIPQEIEGDDVECMGFWWGEASEKYTVGKGSTIAEAVEDLARKMGTQ